MARSLTRVLVARERLHGRIEDQRRTLTHYTRGLERPAGIVDRVLRAGRFVRAHPGVLLAPAAAAFLLRGRSALGLAARGLAVWRFARRAQALLRHVGY
jgi:hypothetical protein